MQCKTFVASAIISELQSSDIYLTVKARLFDLNANLNGVRVTAEFLDEIVNNEEKYIGIPLCADVRGLVANEKIGHMYDRRTGEFHSTAIGSFYHFEKEVLNDNTYLVGYARIMKRNKAVCNAITQLFAQNSLKFSFEISCGEYSEEDDGTIVIDASEHNFLEGAAVVTFPACEEAVALQLVAECLKGDENMHDEQNTELNSEKEEVILVAEEKVEETAAESNTEEQPKEEEKTEETAEEIPATVAETEEKTEDNEKTSDPESEEDTETEDENAACKKKTAADEAMDEEPDEKKEEDPEATEEDAACKKKTAEAVNYDTLIAELKNQIAQLMEEVKSLKENKTEQISETATDIEVASAEEDKNTAETAENVNAEKSIREELLFNPFMAEISTPNKYSLLDKIENTHGYSLLEKR